MSALSQAPAAPTTEIAEYTQTEAALAELRHRFDGVIFDVSTTKGDKEARGFRKELVSLRTGLEAKRKELKAPALARAKAIDDEAKRITGEILALEAPLDDQIKAEEARKEAEKEARAAAERQRIARHHAVIQYLRGIPADVASASSEKIHAELNQLAELEITSSLEEFQGQAQLAKDETLDKLRALHGAALQREAEEVERRAAQEAEAARLAAEREELARLRAEQQEREAQAAAARAEEERKAREAREAEERAHAEKLAAERAAHEAEMKAQREAQEKAEAEARAARAAEEKRLADERAELQRQREEQAAREHAAKLAAAAVEQRIRDAAPQMLAALESVAASGGWDELEVRVRDAVSQAIKAAGQ